MEVYSGCISPNFYNSAYFTINVEEIRLNYWSSKHACEKAIKPGHENPHLCKRFPYKADMKGPYTTEEKKNKTETNMSQKK